MKPWKMEEQSPDWGTALLCLTNGGYCLSPRVREFLCGTPRALEDDAAISLHVITGTDLPWLIQVYSLIDPRPSSEVLNDVGIFVVSACIKLLFVACVAFLFLYLSMSIHHFSSFALDRILRVQSCSGLIRLGAGLQNCHTGEDKPVYVPVLCSNPYTFHSCLL